MGGRIALSAAVSIPMRTGSLIVEAGSPGLAVGVAKDSRVERDEMLAAWIEDVEIEVFVDYWERLPLVVQL